MVPNTGTCIRSSSGQRSWSWTRLGCSSHLAYFSGGLPGIPQLGRRVEPLSCHGGLVLAICHSVPSSAYLGQLLCFLFCLFISASRIPRIDSVAVGGIYGFWRQSQYDVPVDPFWLVTKVNDPLYSFLLPFLLSWLCQFRFMTLVFVVFSTTARGNTYAYLPYACMCAFLVRNLILPKIYVKFELIRL